MKYFKLIIIFLLLIIPSDCFASTNTYKRTKENLLVPNRAIVNKDNIGDILNTPAVNSEEKIYDFANLYRENEEKDLFQNINNYKNNSDIDLVIVTINNLMGFELGEFAYNFYDYNNFEKEGIVFVIYTGENNPKVYMGNIGNKNSKVVKIYTDKRINQIFEYIYPNIKDGNYYYATTNYIKIVTNFYSLDPNGDYRVNSNGQIKKNIPLIELIVFASAMTIIITILFVYKLGLNNEKFTSNWDKNINSTTMMARIIKDELISDNEEKNKTLKK